MHPSNGSRTRIALVGDTTLSSVKDLAVRIRGSEPDVIVFCGDMANELAGAPGGRHLRRWRRRWGDLADRIYPVPGNHDYAADGSLETWWDHAASRLGARAEWYERRAFALRLPGVAIFGLDSGPTARTLDEAQLDWLSARAIADDSAPWTIVVLHGPATPVSLHMNSRMSRDALEALGGFIEVCGAQLVVSGHEHLYARVDGAPPVRAHVIVGGGGAGLYPVVRADLRAGESRHHHLVVDVTHDALRGAAIGTDGERFDAWEWHRTM